MGALEQALRQVKAYMIDKALKESGGNQITAAEKLGIHRNTLSRQMKELGVFNEAQTKQYRARA